MKKLLVPFAVCALVLTGCSTDTTAPEAPTVKSAESSSSEPAVPEAAKSIRGSLIKQIGEGAGFSDKGEQVVTFVINSIAVDVPCTGEYPSPVENGHILALDVSVVTEPALADSLDPTFQMNPNWFTEIAPNGTTSNAGLATMATYGCLPDAEVLPQMMGPGEKVTGKVLLDVTNPTGTLVFKYGGDSSGWEWTYPNP